MLFFILGFIAPWKLTVMFFTRSPLIERCPTYLEGRLNFYRAALDFGVLIFVAQMEIQVEKTLYDLIHSPSYGFKERVWVRETYLGSRKSSIGLKLSLVDAQDKTHMSFTRYLVYVDLQTRKPVNVADRIIPAKHNNIALAPVKRMSLELPEYVFCSEFTASFSDQDQNRHVNINVYLRFCCDCAFEAFSRGQLTDFTDDFQSLKVKSVKARYLNESRVGDKLTVKGWRDVKRQDTLNFVIFKGELRLADITLSFFIEKPTLARL